MCFCSHHFMSLFRAAGLHSHRHYALVNQRSESPSRYHARGKHDTLGAARWVYDACLEAGLVSKLNNIRVTVWLWGSWTTHTLTDTASQSDVSHQGTANMVQTLLSPSSTSWASPIPLVSAWLNGGHISRLHLLWHCMCVCECRQGVSQWLMHPQ